MTDSFEDHCWKDIIDADSLEIYKHYRRTTFVGSRPALLVIDLYNLSYGGGPRPVVEIVNDYPSSCGINAWNAIKPTQELLQIARKNGLPVIYSRQKNDMGIFPTNRKKMGGDENSFEIKEEFKPQDQDIMIYKERASCFFGTPLIAYLNKLDINGLIVCGETTSGCVRATVVDAYSYGFHTVVVEECCFDRSEMTHKMNLFDLHHKYADVMSLTELKDKLSANLI